MPEKTLHVAKYTNNSSSRQLVFEYLSYMVHKEFMDKSTHQTVPERGQADMRMEPQSLHGQTEVLPFQNCLEHSFLHA